MFARALVLLALSSALATPAARAKDGPGASSARAASLDAWLPPLVRGMGPEEKLLVTWSSVEARDQIEAVIDRFPYLEERVDVTRVDAGDGLRATELVLEQRGRACGVFIDLDAYWQVGPCVPFWDRVGPVGPAPSPAPVRYAVNVFELEEERELADLDSARRYSRRRDWERVYQRSRGTAIAGVELTLGGAAFVGAGLALLTSANGFDDAGAAVLGVLALTAGVPSAVLGPPLLAGGTMQMHRSLQERGVKVPVGLGAATWVLMGSALVVPFALGASEDPVLQGLGFGTLVGGYVGMTTTGTVFLVQLHRAHRGAGLASATRARPTLALTPRPDGLQLSGTW